MTSVFWLPQAETDMEEAIDFYETTAAGLGLSFVTEVEQTIERLRANPESGTLVVRKIRNTKIT